MSIQHYHKVITLLRSTPTETTKIFQALEDAAGSGMQQDIFRDLTEIVFCNGSFVQHISANDPQTMEFLAGFPLERRWLAANPSTSAELLRELANHDLDHEVLLNLKEQAAKREDLKDLRAGFDHLKTHQQELEAIVDILNKVTREANVPIKDIKITDETYVSIEKDLLCIDLAGNAQISDQGWLYHERAYKLTQHYYTPGHEKDPDFLNEHEIGLYSSIPYVAIEAVLNLISIRTNQDIKQVREGFSDQIRSLFNQNTDLTDEAKKERQQEEFGSRMG